MNDQISGNAPVKEARSHILADPLFNAAAPSVGTPDADTLIGTDAADEISGEAGRDSITGLGGDDTIDGGSQWDTIDAGAGDDVVDGGWGSDSVALGDGNDLFEDNGQNDTNGRDTVDGAAGNDTIAGLGGDDVFLGGDGNDQISGGIGDDVLDGGNGNDILEGGDGNDTIRGGSQYDTIDAGAGDDDVDGGNGRDSVQLGDGNDIFRDNGQGGIHGLDFVEGGAGDDTILGGGGDDTFRGDSGRDDISGGDGNDVVDGGNGQDLLTGGAGADTIDGGSQYDTIDAGDGDDVVLGGNGRDDVQLGDGDDIFQDNNQTGTHALDTVDGGAGNDTILGGGGDDDFAGGAGDDQISGGAGDDLLSGGAGADTFVFDTDDGTDIITDFVSGEDAIVFEGVDAGFADLLIQDAGPNLSVTLGDTTIQLEGVAAADLSANDFAFPDGTPVNVDPDAIVMPDFATIIDVADFGIIADDGIDDTAAIQAMLDTTDRSTYFFSDGVYDISDTIIIPDGRGTSVPSFVTLQGESEDGTVFKLADGLDHQGPIFGSEGNVAQAFNNRVRDLTFDIGTGNPNATGLQFAGNNQSTVKDVTIRSEDGGSVGLDLASQSQFGPALIEDVTVEGFDIGISMAIQVNSVTLEDIDLIGQETGIVSTLAHVAFLRGIDYDGAGVAVDNDGVSRMLLIDSDLRSSDPGQADQVAIENGFSLYASDVAVTGFDTSIEYTTNNFLGNRLESSGDVDEYWAFGDAPTARGGTFQLFDSPETGLGLDVRETPETVWNSNVGTWVDVRDFGAVEGEDASAAFQAAIDSGATTVYVPDGFWTLESEVVLRGNVEQFLSAGYARTAPGSVFRIAEGASDQIMIEGIHGPMNGRDATLFLHDSDRTVVMRDMAATRYEAVADGEQGDVYLANVTGKHMSFHDQNVWARQLNVEGDNAETGIEAKVLNDGAAVWIMGLKTEDPGTVVKTINGGQTELMGSYHNGPVDVSIPRFITEDASFFTTIVDGSTASQDFDLVRETRDGVTREGNIKENNNRGDAYSAFDPAVIADRVIIVDNDDASTTGTWQSATSFPGGFLGGDFLFAQGDSGASIEYSATAVAAGSYTVSLRIIDERGGQPNSGHSREVDVEFGTDDDVFVFEDVDLRTVEGPWLDLGVIEVATDGQMFVRLDTDGVTGNVIADSVRFERLEPEDTLLG